jgi:hypothetical protein
MRDQGGLDRIRLDGLVQCGVGLPERVEHVPVEFGTFVEEERAAVYQDMPPGCAPRSAVSFAR